MYTEGIPGMTDWLFGFGKPNELLLMILM